MGLGGFSCSKNALAALNVLYIFVSFILIGVAAYARVVAIITSLSLVGGIIACGVFLFFVAVIGLVGALRHHQVLLFFYMIILFLVFLIQFAVACACLAVNKEQQKTIAASAWAHSKNEFKSKVQYELKCCGFENDLSENDPSGMGHPDCGGLDCCSTDEARETYPCCNGVYNGTEVPTCPCQNKCFDIISNHMNEAFKITGGIGLFFSFTEIIGVWLALRFRNQKDPRANPSAFL